MPFLEIHGGFMQLAGKGNKVRMWLKAHLGEIRYAILDDVPDFLPEQEPFYVMTDPRTGSTNSHNFLLF